VDILKAEFPLDVHEPDESKWQPALRGLSEASSAPWILLSAAVDFDTFLRQVTAACQAGASGTAVGRAVWQEAVTMENNQRLGFLRSTAHQRLARLTSLCHALARPYTEFYSSSAPLDWYRTY
jgi:tagatose-1,6-bisphosphate aldolase